MKKQIKHLMLHYEYLNHGLSKTIVLLHGWGQNLEMMRPIADLYQNDFNVLLLDLPGFGKSEEPNSSWTIFQYASFLNEFFESLNIKNPILIGHSFGGKIALVYASKYKLEKLVCFSSPYCKEMDQLPFKTKLYKFFKKIFFLKLIAKMMKPFIGSTDYKNASECMRGVLVQSVNLNLHEEVKKISCPVLLIWGSEDTAVPLSRAYELEKLIPDAGVVVYEGATHYAYLEQLQNIKVVLDSFFEIRR